MSESGKSTRSEFSEERYKEKQLEAQRVKEEKEQLQKRTNELMQALQ